MKSKSEEIIQAGKKSFAKEHSGKCNSIEMMSDRPLLGQQMMKKE